MKKRTRCHCPTCVEIRRAADALRTGTCTCTECCGVVEQIDQQDGRLGNEA